MTDLNFQMRSDFYRHIFIGPASDSFPQLDVFSREQVLNLLTELGHKVVPIGYLLLWWLLFCPLLLLKLMLTLLLYVPLHQVDLSLLLQVVLIQVVLHLLVYVLGLPLLL